MDKADAIRKIKACLARAKSDNADEAATALRQANSLMKLYQVEDSDVLAADVEERLSTAGAKDRPVSWECDLATICARAFASRLIFRGNWNTGKWVFIGLPPSAELSQYAFDVLFRAAKKARRDYMATALKRYRNRANKTAAADQYAEGWVRGVARNLPRVEESAQQAAALDAFMAKLKLGSLKPTENQGKGRANDYSHRATGRADGSEVELARGVGAAAQPKRIGRGA